MQNHHDETRTGRGGNRLELIDVVCRVRVTSRDASVWWGIETTLVDQSASWLPLLTVIYQLLVHLLRFDICSDHNCAAYKHATLL